MAVNWIDRSVPQAKPAPRLRVTSPAVKDAARLGLSTERLIEMAYLGAFITHPNANRRFDRFIMLVQDDTVMGVWPYTPPAQHVCDGDCNHDGMSADRWVRKTYTCPICEGDGGICMECRGKRTIVCTAEEYERLQDIALAAIR